MSRVADIFVYLGEQPLLWLFLTLFAYLLAEWLHRTAGRNALTNPVALSALAVALVLVWTKTDYPQYFAGAQFIHFLLGPAIVVLALPIYQHAKAIWQARLAILAALLAGFIVSTACVIGLALWLDLPADLTASVAPRSVTAPIAMGIAEELGGNTSIAAVLAVITGITGAILVTPLFNALGLRDWRARGFALGASCHGIGTAHAFQVNQVAGSFATIGMAMNGVFASLALPLLFKFLFE